MSTEEGEWENALSLGCRYASGYKIEVRICHDGKVMVRQSGDAVQGGYAIRFIRVDELARLMTAKGVDPFGLVDIVTNDPAASPYCLDLPLVLWDDRDCKDVADWLFASATTAKPVTN